MRKDIVPSLGEPVGNLWKDLQTKYTESGEFWVFSPISNTPLPVYEWIKSHAKEIPHWDRFFKGLMDEQAKQTAEGLIYVDKSDPASFEGKIRTILLDPLEETTGVPLRDHVLKPDLNDLKAFDKKIEEHGGIDLLILAIGEGGHYAQVMPGTPIETGFHVTELLGDYKDRHQQTGIFSGSEFQRYGMSLGHQQLLGAKKVVIIISGEKKHELAKQLLSYDSFDPSFPLSIIYDPRVNERVQLFITEDVGIK